MLVALFLSESPSVSLIELPYNSSREKVKKNYDYDLFTAENKVNAFELILSLWRFEVISTSSVLSCSFQEGSGKW